MSSKILIAKPGYNVLDSNSGISQPQHNYYVDAIYGSGGYSEAMAQSFVSVNNKIKSVDLKIAIYGNPTDNIQLDIVSILSGSSLGSAIVSASSITSGNYVHFIFSSSIDIEIGQTYYLQLTRSGARNTSNFCAWYEYYNQSVYADGMSYIESNGAWSSPADYQTTDFVFKIYPDNISDPNNLIFSSDYNTLKYDISGNITQTINYADYYDSGDIPPFGTWYYHRKETTVPHNLGYIPFFTAFVEGFGGAGKYNMCPGTFQDVLIYTYAQAYADDTNLYLVTEMRNQFNSGNGSQDYIYKIFRNNLGF